MTRCSFLLISWPSIAETHLPSFMPYLALGAPLQAFCMCVGYSGSLRSLACIQLSHHFNRLGCVS